MMNIQLTINRQVSPSLASSLPRGPAILVLVGGDVMTGWMHGWIYLIVAAALLSTEHVHATGKGIHLLLLGSLHLSRRGASGSSRGYSKNRDTTREDKNNGEHEYMNDNASRNAIKAYYVAVHNQFQCTKYSTLTT
jgi:hypothetical protein